MDIASKAQLDRIEAKLDILIAALADDDVEPLEDLDGFEYPGARDTTQSLG